MGFISWGGGLHTHTVYFTATGCLWRPEVRTFLTISKSAKRSQSFRRSGSTSAQQMTRRGRKKKAQWKHNTVEHSQYCRISQWIVQVSECLNNVVVVFEFTQESVNGLITNSRKRSGVNLRFIPYPGWGVAPVSCGEEESWAERKRWVKISFFVHL